MIQNLKIFNTLICLLNLILQIGIGLISGEFNWSALCGWVAGTLGWGLLASNSK